MTEPSPGPTSFRTLGRQTAIYSFGVMLGRAVSFLMLPVYTRYLTPSDYGLVYVYTRSPRGRCDACATRKE